MAHTRTWDAANEASPADGDNVSAGAGKIRDFKVDVRERMAKDHYMDIAGTDADHGEHEKITFNAPLGADPSNVANKGFLYTKDVSAKVELFWEDEDGNVVQLTFGGVASVPSGTKMLVYADTAPTGWTIDNTLDDKVVHVTKGSAAGGETGGGAHSTGTWTQPNHTHTSAAHTHTLPIGSRQGAAQVLGWKNTQTSGTFTSTHGVSTTAEAYTQDRLVSDSTTPGATGGSATANTWRPASYCFIICSKD